MPKSLPLDVRRVLYNCFSEFYHFMAFYLGLMGKVKRKRESTNKREGDSTLIIKTDMNYVFPWGVVGREKARVNGERDSTLIKLI